MSTVHSASLPTLEMTNGETATFLQAGGEMRSINNSGSSKLRSPFCCIWSRFQTSRLGRDIGVIRVWYKGSESFQMLSLPCLAPSVQRYGIHLKTVISGSKTVLSETLYSPLFFQVEVLCPREHLGGNGCHLFRDSLFGHSLLLKLVL